MKLNRTLHVALLVSSVLFSYSASAESSDERVSSTVQIVNEGIQEQAPQMPEGIEVSQLPRTAQSSRQVNPSCYASYMIQKDGYRSQRHPDRLYFRVTVTNLGDCNLRNVRVTDFFPSHTELKDTRPNADYTNSERAVWNIEWLPVGSEKNLDLAFEVKHWVHNRWITNNACAWNNVIGQRICAWASVWWN
jgi:uncharacterized repeat protein (TIGR01451 family)